MRSTTMELINCPLVKKIIDGQESCKLKSIEERQNSEDPSNSRWLCETLARLPGQMKGMKLASGNAKHCKLPQQMMGKKKHRLKAPLMVGLQRLILPNQGGRRRHMNINFLLAKTLEYLNSIKASGYSSTDAEDSNSIQSLNVWSGASTSTSIPRQVRSIEISRLSSDARNSRYKFTFDHAPFGVILCRCDGSLIRENPYFQKMEQCNHVLKVISNIISKTKANDALQVTVAAQFACISP
jgi:hypothetical protein